MLHKGADSKVPSSFFIVLVRGTIGSFSGQRTSQITGVEMVFVSTTTSTRAVTVDTKRYGILYARHKVFTQGKSTPVLGPVPHSLPGKNADWVALIDK